jgi:hypothetical protein
MDDHSTADQASRVLTNVKGNVKDALENDRGFAERVQNTTAGAMSTIQEAAIEAGTKVSDLATATYNRGVKAGEYLSTSTAEQPLLALLLAGAVGYAIAFLLHSRVFRQQ